MTTDTDHTHTILLVNPNTNTRTTALMVAVANETVVGTGFVVVGVTAAVGPKMIIEPEALQSAVEHVIDATLHGIEVHHPVAVIVSAYGDPGIVELRSRVKIPVIGIGQASILEAGAHGRRFAIATTTGQLRPAIDALVRFNCPEGDYAGTWLTDHEPLTLARDDAASLAQLGRAVDAAVAAGAQAVVIGGGPLSGSARELSVRTDVAIIEPIPSAVRKVLAEFSVLNRYR